MMASTASRSSDRRAGLWSWIIGGTTFLITTLFPPLPAINYSLVPGWLSPLIGYGAAGGIGWQMLHYVRENTLRAYPLGALLWMILPFCIVPIVLTVSSVLVWRRMVNSTFRPTVKRGLVAVVVAEGFTLLVICVLDAVLGAVLIFSGMEAALLGTAIFGMAALAQLLWVLPALLIVGAVLALWQARSRIA